MARSLDGGAAVASAAQSVVSQFTPFGGYRCNSKVVWETRPMAPLPADTWGMTTWNTAGVATESTQGTCRLYAVSSGVGNSGTLTLTALRANYVAQGQMTHNIIDCSLDVSTVTGLSEFRVGFNGRGDTDVPTYLQVTVEDGVRSVSLIHDAYDYRVAPQASWNMDTLDGNGPSRLTLFPSAAVVPVTAVVSVSQSLTRFGFIIDGRLVYAHEFSVGRKSVSALAIGNAVNAFMYVNAGDGGTATAYLRAVSVHTDNIVARLPPTYTYAFGTGSASVLVPQAAFGSFGLIVGIKTSGWINGTTNYLPISVRVRSVQVYNGSASWVVCHLLSQPSSVGVSITDEFRNGASGAFVATGENIAAPGLPVIVQEGANTVRMATFFVAPSSAVVVPIPVESADARMACYTNGSVFTLVGKNTTVGFASVSGCISWDEFH